MASRWRVTMLAVAVFAAACGGGTEDAGGDDAPPESTSTTTTTIAEEAPPPTLDLDDDLLIFAPVPPTDGPLPDGAVDFWELFENPESWADVAAEIDAVKLHGAQFRFGFSNEQIEAIIAGLEALELPLILEVEPLDHPDPERCAHNESYEGPYEIDTMRRIKALGGHIAAIAIEQPHSFNTIMTGPTACQDPVEETVAQVMDWIIRARSVYPDIPVGSIEGVWRETTAEHYASWLDTYEEMAGEPFAFIHVDIGWDIRSDWTTIVREIEDVADARDVPFGVLWNGNDAQVETDWIPITADRIVEYEHGTVGGSPQHTSIQSWVPWPDRVLPVDDINAMTNLVHRYRAGIADVAPPAVSDDGLSGVVTVDGAPAPGLEVVVERTPRSGQRQTVRLDGVVPDGAVQAVVQVRSNDEYSAPGDADATIYDLAYSEAGTAEASLPNGSFEAGLSSWAAYGDDAAGVSATTVDGDGALSLRVGAGLATFVDSVPFTVTAGEAYVFDITFSFTPESARTTHVALIFFDDTAEFGRAELELRPYEEEVGRATTAADGSFTVGPPEAFVGDVDAIVRVVGTTELLGGRWEGRLG